MAPGPASAVFAVFPAGGEALHVPLFVFSSRLSSALSQPFSPADALEVIITIASGFISIYSHNNTEKWQTDGPGVMY